MLTTRQLVRAFGSLRAVDGVDLEVRFRGEPIGGLAPDRVFRKGVARTFQVPRPFPRMTVLEKEIWRDPKFAKVSV